MKHWKNWPTWLKWGALFFGLAVVFSFTTIGCVYYGTNWSGLGCVIIYIIFLGISLAPFTYFIPDLDKQNEFVIAVLACLVWFVVGSILGYIYGKVMPFFRKRIKSSTRETIGGWIGLVVIILIIWLLSFLFGY